MRMLEKLERSSEDYEGANVELLSLTAVFDFLFRFGQSLDWVFRGDARIMISRCAASE